MKKRLWSILLLVCMLTAMVPLVETEAQATENWLWPVDGVYTMSRGYNASIEHWGIDIANGSVRGKAVLAAKGGTVIASSNSCPHDTADQYCPGYWDDNYKLWCSESMGNYAVIDHGDGTWTRYMHMIQGTVIAQGSTVVRGQKIGEVGSSGMSTGDHLHFEVYTNYPSRIRKDPAPIDWDNRHGSYNYQNISNPTIRYDYEIATASPTEAYLSKCTLYPSYLKVKTTVDTQLRTLPSFKDQSELVLTLSSGEIETITGLYYTPDHEIWYRTEYNGKTCYLYAGHVEVVEFLQSSSIRDVVAPNVLANGKSFTIEGVISTKYTQLFQAAAAVETGTETLLHAWDGTTSNTYSLKSSNVDHGIPFGTLSEGYYAYIVYVGERSYYWDGDSLEYRDLWPAVWRSSFTVGSPASATPGKPALKNMQSVYEEGETITFDWDTTVNTTHYSIYIYKEDASGAYEIIDELHYYKPNRTYSIEESGNYRIMLQAVNSSALTPDGSTWNHSDGDWVYFRVGCKHSSTTKTAAKAATCTAAGNKAYYTCSSCKEVFEDQAATKPTTKAAMTVPKLGHLLTEHKAKEPTCTEDGNIAFYYCNRCSKRYTDPEGKATVTQAGTIIQALDHNYIGGTCSRCGDTVIEPGITDAYALGEILLVSEKGEILSAIPNQNFWAAVTLTKKVEVADGYVFVATYAPDGQFIRMFAMRAGIPVGTTTELCVLLDHSDGEIGEVRAFVLDSLTGMTPLAMSVSMK